LNSLKFQLRKYLCQAVEELRRALHLVQLLSRVRQRFFDELVGVAVLDVALDLDFGRNALLRRALHLLLVGFCGHGIGGALSGVNASLLAYKK